MLQKQQEYPQNAFIIHLILLLSREEQLDLSKSRHQIVLRAFVLVLETYALAIQFSPTSHNTCPSISSAEQTSMLTRGFDPYKHLFSDDIVQSGGKEHVLLQEEKTQDSHLQLIPRSTYRVNVSRVNDLELCLLAGIYVGQACCSDSAVTKRDEITEYVFPRRIHSSTLDKPYTTSKILNITQEEEVKRCPFLHGSFCNTKSYLIGHKSVLVTSNRFVKQRVTRGNAWESGAYGRAKPW